jgi:alpha-D-xyloside xylohydrolase
MRLNRRLKNEGQLVDDWQALDARCREMIEWRMRPAPYLMAAFEQYAADGTPPFRVLALDAPKELCLYNVDDQYMAGDRMMVAPLFAGAPGRSVVMPQGGWHDFLTGKAVRGGSEIFIPASSDRIPVYVKRGSITPLDSCRTVRRRAGDSAHYGAYVRRRLASF